MKKILLVEDDALLNKTLTYNLISEGYDTVSALNAGTAVQLLVQTEYDLVLLDINLPDGSGYDLCRLIKPENPDTLVIFLTANDQDSDQIRGYEVGAVDYITKPFYIRALLRITVIAISLATFLMASVLLLVSGIITVNQNGGNNITGSYHALISGIEKEQYQKLSDDVRVDLCGFTVSIGSVKSGNDRLNISYSNNDALTLNGLSVSEGKMPDRL